jgi:uncharacterized metal-binding protein YceD (DUF177 family)
MRPDDLPWIAPVVVAELHDDGLQVAIEANDAQRAAIAKLGGLRDLPKLSATFELTPVGAGEVRVDGHLSAIVGQTCVVTLEPMENTIEEDVSLVFVPATSIPTDKATDADVDAEHEPPEPIVNGKIDLAKIATEFLLLGIDPYPRKPGAVFEPVHTPADPADHPFAGLAALKEPKQSTDPPKPLRKGS